MIRRLARGAGRAALGIAILAALLVAVLHTPPGRNLLRSFVLAGLRRGGLDVRLDHIEVEPLRLEARVFGLELARPGYRPFLRVLQATLRFPGKALRGQVALREAGGLEVSATGLDLEWSGERRRGTLRAREDVAWRAEARQGRLTLSPAAIAADDRTLTARAVLAVFRTARPTAENGTCWSRS